MLFAIKAEISGYGSVLAPDRLATASFDGPRAREGTAIYDKPKDQKGKRIGTVVGGRPVRGFFTPSGKVEFVADGSRTPSTHST